MDVSLLAVIGIAMGTMFFGYFFGLFEGRGQGYKRRKKEEAAEGLRMSPAAPQGPAVVPVDKGLLMLSRDAQGKARLHLDGRPIAAAPAAPEDRKRLIDLMVLLRPWVEPAADAGRLATSPADAKPQVAEPRPRFGVPTESVQGVAAVLGGHAMAFTGVGTSIPQIREGTMRGLATYLAERMPDLPDIPTLREMGYDIVVESRLCIYGPPGVPNDVVKILEDAFHKAMDDKDLKKICANFELIPSYLDADQIDKHHRDQAAKTQPILKKLGMIKD